MSGSPSTTSCPNQATSGAAGPSVRYTELLYRLHPVGTPEHCRTMLSTTARRTGINHVILLVEGAGDRARTLENIIRLGTEVLPMLRDRSPNSSGHLPAAHDQVETRSG